MITYIKASNTGDEDRFGHSVALSADGNTLAVGAPNESSNARGPKHPGDPDYFTSQEDDSAMFSGAVYIFTRSGDTWSQQAYLKAFNSDGGDGFGWAVSISNDGNTLAVAAPFECGDGSISGEDNSLLASGAVYIFSRSGDTWFWDCYLKASNPDREDHFGRSIFLSGDGTTLAVGAPGEDSGYEDNPDDNSETNSGAVYLFIKDVSFCYQQAYLKAFIVDDPQDYFGSSVSLSDDGETLMVGVPFEDSGNNLPDDNSLSDSGAFYLFSRTGFNWDVPVFLKPSVKAVDSRIGLSVALSWDGSIAVAGNGWNKPVGIFYDNGSFWAESPTPLVEAPYVDPGDSFGHCVALSGTGLILAVGAPDEASSATGINGDQSDNSIDGSGAVHLYFRSSAVSNFWYLLYIKASNPTYGDSFGDSIALSNDGRIMAVGAEYEDSGATGIGGDQNDDSVSDSGAVYIYDLGAYY